MISTTAAEIQLLQYIWNLLRDGVEDERFEFTTETSLVLPSGVLKCDAESTTDTVVYEDDGICKSADCKDFTEQLLSDISIEKRKTKLFIFGDHIKQSKI